MGSSERVNRITMEPGRCTARCVSKELRTGVQTKMRTGLFIAVFTVSRKWKQPTHPSVSACIMGSCSTLTEWGTNTCGQEAHLWLPGAGGRGTWGVSAPWFRCLSWGWWKPRGARCGDPRWGSIPDAVNLLCYWDVHVLVVTVIGLLLCILQ